MAFVSGECIVTIGRGREGCTNGVMLIRFLEEGMVELTPELDSVMAFDVQTLTALVLFLISVKSTRVIF